ncbi:anti-sigma factor [Corynebacterium kutscheri]|uniref:Anti-sigma factor n=1 Tax=Corynebacterium kutscheri TaxID=35755 RepID=A0A0F6R0V8_9CORY|nr:anti-sigma factor [Corynebacterium kutscheri]AKE41937.1 hypothetical protein UL82_08960 [Corynebacterium kutscheri]VEH06418.1 anti-sigma factor [Corynebacterium kutscheri]VEH10274.1 anti-sigma factor [Corynebacterium kutscheri]VEH82331.1 anti-sigma factor [Corynebacterium kutscheri]
MSPTGHSEPFDDFPPDVEDLLAQAPAPITPSAQLRDNILDAIAATSQEEPEATYEPLDNTPAEPIADVIQLPARHKFMRGFLAAAASVAIIAGGFTLWPQADPHAEMHSILAASDVRQANTDAMGASLNIVVSSSMNEGGALVDGAPKLNEGMGAQVWAVMEDGSTKSAGVIGPEDHDGVWMPLPGETSKVMITEEPLKGSTEPKGTVLAIVKV